MENWPFEFVDGTVGAGSAAAGEARVGSGGGGGGGIEAVGFGSGDAGPVVGTAPGVADGPDPEDGAAVAARLKSMITRNGL